LFSKVVYIKGKVSRPMSLEGFGVNPDYKSY